MCLLFSCGLDLDGINTHADMVVVGSGYNTADLHDIPLAENRKKMPDVFLYGEIHYHWLKYSKNIVDTLLFGPYPRFVSQGFLFESNSKVFSR